MAPQSYRDVTTHENEILGWSIISRILHEQAPNIRGMNIYVHSELVTLAFNKG